MVVYFWCFTVEVGQTNVWSKQLQCLPNSHISRRPSTATPFNSVVIFKLWFYKLGKYKQYADSRLAFHSISLQLLGQSVADQMKYWMELYTYRIRFVLLRISDYLPYASCNSLFDWTIQTYTDSLCTSFV